MKYRNRSNKAVSVITLTTLVAMIALATNVFLVSVEQLHLRSNEDIRPHMNATYVKDSVIKSVRGKILDRAGNVIAEDNHTFNIYCILDPNRINADDTPAYVFDKQDAAKKIAPILHMEVDDLLRYLNQKDLYQTELGLAGRNLSKTTMEDIKALNIPGIGFTESVERVYPLGTFASNLIGFAQSDENGSIVGKMGTELYLNSYLAGKDGHIVAQVDKQGYIMPGMHKDVISPVNGNNVTLTLDHEIQEALEESFKMTEERFDADRIWGSVMDIKTGKILAWGQYPSFDPNVREIKDYNNYGAQLPYEPGSTLKAFTWAAAMNEGKYDGSAKVDSGPYSFKSDEYNNPVRVKSGGYGTIYNARRKQWGMIDYDYGLIYSSNTITAEVQNSLINPDIHLDYLKRFGFFQPVSTDGLPEETGRLNFIWPADKLALSYGQGSTVTMLQMLQAYSAIFGDGNMVRPYYVDNIVDPYDSNKVIYQAKPKITGTPITAKTAHDEQKILYRVINDHDGTGKFYQIPECKLIGKTGTTQVASNGSYQSGYTISSIMTALPAEDPQVMVYYCFESPYDPNAHVDTKPVTSLIRKTAMRLALAGNKNIDTTATLDGEKTPLDEETETLKEIKTYEMMPLVNHSLEYAKDKLKETHAEVIVLGSGTTVIDQYPVENSYINTNDKVFLLTDTNSFTMMDMTGWTRKDVTGLWQVSQFGFKLEGYGKVIKQNIPPGSKVSRGDQIEVEFEENKKV